LANASALPNRDRNDFLKPSISCLVAFGMRMPVCQPAGTAHRESLTRGGVSAARKPVAQAWRSDPS
jgi:hypothetical protein